MYMSQLPFPMSHVSISFDHFCRVWGWFLATFVASNMTLWGDDFRPADWATHLRQGEMAKHGNSWNIIKLKFTLEVLMTLLVKSGYLTYKEVICAPDAILLHIGLRRATSVTFGEIQISRWESTPQGRGYSLGIALPFCFFIFVLFEQNKDKKTAHRHCHSLLCWARYALFLGPIIAPTQHKWPKPQALCVVPGHL